MKKKIPKTWVTAYDIFSARVAEKSGVDTILVGDSLGMVVYGMENTHGVTKEMMAQHFLAVQKGAPNTRIVIDFPFGCAENILNAVETAEFFSNIGAKIFKIEGGIENLEIFLELRSRGYEIVGHLGLTPQSITDWKVQGNTEVESEKIFSAVKKFSSIGIKEIILECVPQSVGKKSQEIITSKNSGDIIGIGAGRHVNAQVLVFDDVVGRSEKKFSPKFLKRYTDSEKVSINALKNFVSEVQEKKFPAEKNVY